MTTSVISTTPTMPIIGNFPTRTNFEFSITGSNVDSTPHTDDAREQQNDDSSNAGGIVAGCVVAFIILAAIIICLITFLIWYRAKQKRGEFVYKDNLNAVNVIM